MRQRDLAGHVLVIIADVGRRIATPMLKFDPETHPKLLDIELRAVPIDPDPLADPARVIRREISVLFHRVSLTYKRKLWRSPDAAADREELLRRVLTVTRTKRRWFYPVSAGEGKTGRVNVSNPC